MGGFHDYVHLAMCCVPGDDERTVLFLLHCFLCGPNYSASECVMCTFWPDKWVQHSGPVAFLLTLLHTFLFYLECYLFVCFHTCDWGWNMGWKIQNSATYVLKKSSNARNISRLSQVVRELNIQIARVFPAFLTGRTICILSSGHINTLHLRHNPLVSSHQAPPCWCCPGFWPPALQHASSVAPTATIFPSCFQIELPPIVLK